MPVAPHEVTESKAERVYRELSDAILRGEYTPGYRLVLSRLADDYGVSPVPVREAVRRLEAQGLVRHTRNVGFEVAGVDEAGYSEAMETLAILEAAATARSAPLLDQATLDRAENLNEQMAELGSSEPARFTDLNVQFHLELTAACPNSHLRDLLRREWHHLSRLRRTSFHLLPGRPVQSVAEHREILQLIREGAEQGRLEEAVRAHTLRTRDQFLSRLH